MRHLILLTLIASLALAPAGATAQAGESAPPRRLPENTQAKPIAIRTQGTLRRNPEAKTNDSQYALLDAQGQVACFVQPQQGVKLAQYVGRRVILAGTSSTNADDATIFAAQSVELAVKDPAFAQQASAEEIADDVELENVVAPAQFEEELPFPMELGSPGEPYYQGPEEMIGPDAGQIGVDHLNHGCNSCGDWGCGDCCRNGCLSGVYVRAEYLHWWTDGMFTPALVTTSPAGTPRANAGVLGVPGTTILFGDDPLNNDDRSGFRVSLGRWFDAGRCHAIEGDYWWLGDGDDDFFASSPGSPILARPYFDIVGGTETSELVAFPNVLRGSVRVDTQTDLLGAGLRKRWNLCGSNVCDPCFGCGWRYDVTAGYRFMRLRDSIAITEDLVSTDTANPGSFIVFDRFATENTFNGAEVGTVFEGKRGRWTLDLLGRLAVGNTRSRVDIDGFTDITTGAGVTTRNTGGLLAQRTNIGEYTRDNLAIVPELGANVGLQLSSVWRVTFGYTFIYWSNVVRAGQQIDRDVNENLLAPEANPFTGPERPRFEFDHTDFWAQGVNVGLDARW